MYSFKILDSNESSDPIAVDDNFDGIDRVLSRLPNFLKGLQTHDVVEVYDPAGRKILILTSSWAIDFIAPEYHRTDLQEGDFPFGVPKVE